MQNLDTAFEYYLEKLNKGYYEVPFVLETIDILKKKYIPDNLDINHEFSYDTIRDKGFFIENILRIFGNDVQSIDKEILNDEDLINRQIPVITECIIKFPKITITNSREEKHVIKDLFLFIDFYKKGSIHHDSFYFKRSTFTLTELYKGYMHSHVGTMNVANYERSIFEIKYNPCLGSTTLNNIVNMFKYSYENSFFNDLDYYNLQVGTLFNLLDIFVSWESLEGTPFISISGLINNEIQSGTLSRNASNNEKSFFDTIKSSFILNNIDLSSYLKVYPTLKRKKPWYSIKYDAFELSTLIYKLKDQCSLLEPYFRENYYSQLCAKNELGETVFYNRNDYENVQIKEELEDLRGRFIFYFKGEPVYFEIKDIERDETILYECLHKNLLELFIREIENYINYEKKIYIT